MSRSAARVANVVPLHADEPFLTARERARLDLLELLQELDPASQKVVLDQLAAGQRVLRRYGPTGRLVRGERGPVAWRAGHGTRWLVAPGGRRYLALRANG